MASASAAPPMAPLIWLAMTAAAWPMPQRCGVRRPSSQSVAVTTGLKCAPPAWMNTTISTARPSAVTTELTSSRSAPSGVSRVAAIPDPTTTATSRPVPVNSAASRLATAAFMRWRA